MPSEPEKRIEPLLKAYAEKRRQAGASQPGLHPATRRLLQAEARQRWPTRGSSASPRWYQKIITFWPRLVMAGAIAVVLGMGLWFLAPANKPASTNMAKQDTLSRLPAKPADEIVLTTGGSRNEPAADAEFDRVKLTEKQADVKKLADTSGMREQKVSLESVSQRGVADQPAPVASPTLAVPTQMKAKEVVPPATKPAEPSPTRRPVAPLAAAPTAGGVPLPASRANERLAENIQRDSRVLTEEAQAARGRYVVLAPTSTPETTNRPLTVLSFNESVPARQYYFRNLSATPSPQVPGAPQAAGRAGAGAEPQSLRADRSLARPVGQAGPPGGVLVNFAIEQRGPALRIIDDDGSVYEGRVLVNAEPAVAAEFRQSVALKREAPAPSPTPTPALSKSISETRVAELSVDKNTMGKDADGFGDAARPQLAFEVSGTNNTLRQNVSLAGTLYFSSTNVLVATNTARFQRGFGAVTLNDGYIATQDGKAQANTNFSQVLRILGRGRVNGSNELSVDAVPAQR
jgi:hypothetical protein